MPVCAEGPTLAAFGLMALVFGRVNLVSVAVWALPGQPMARLLTKPRRLSAFHRTMAALHVAAP